jgi:hypothetical protein
MTRRIYVPPAPDEPLDDVQRALARALARIIVKQIREQAHQPPAPALTDTTAEPDSVQLACVIRCQ